jgi:hypothetical protein
MGAATRPAPRSGTTSFRLGGRTPEKSPTGLPLIQGTHLLLATTTRTRVRYPTAGAGSATTERTVPRQSQPVAADVKALYVDDCLRRLACVRAEGGDANLAALGRSWPQLAEQLEALAATLVLPVREP